MRKPSADASVSGSGLASGSKGTPWSIKVIDTVLSSFSVSILTLTFPVSGRFTARQRQLYDIVLRGNKLVASLARAGVTTGWLNEQLINFYEDELGRIGLLENGRTVRDYYWHGVSHNIGLETHDVTLPDVPLVAGSVISDEPGLYLEDEGIGIRIEDDLLITESGCEVLSKDIIKEIDEIEAFMAGN